MAGKIKELIDALIRQRCKGNESVAATTRTKLLLKGIDPGKYTALSEDDPEIIARVRAIAKEMNITL